MRTARKRRSRVLSFLRMALLSAMAVVPFLTLLAPESGGATAPPDSVSAAAAAPAGRHAAQATGDRRQATVPASSPKAQPRVQATGDRRQATVLASSPTVQPRAARQARALRGHNRGQRHALVIARHRVTYDRYSLLI